jgi:CRISPR-associated exonuclease Cas4
MAVTLSYAEDDLVPLSALQHFIFCPRQCALIHLEQTWEENRFTAEGRLQHKRVDTGGSEKRRGVRQAFSLPIRSLRLGLSGKDDMVEFPLGEDGLWRPYPVERKRGRRKEEDWDRVQLCAQALCLEEMLGFLVPEGALFYEKERHREVVALDEALRRRTEETAGAVHEMMDAGRTPPPTYTPKCDACSLLSRCLPKGVGVRSRVDRYFVRMLGEP